jgi:Nse4 C-terminal
METQSQSSGRDAEKRKEDAIKNEYLMLLKSVEENRENICEEEGADNVYRIFRRSTDLLKSVRKSSEMRLDAKVSGEAVEIANARIAKMCKGTGISLGEFLKKIASKECKDPGDNEYFESGDGLVHRGNFGFFSYVGRFFFGTRFPQGRLNIGSEDGDGRGESGGKEEEKRERRKRKQSCIKELEVPGDEKKSDEHDLLMRIKFTYELVCKRGRTRFYDLVLSPDSFAETVENVFYLSFVVKLERLFLEWEGNVIWITSKRAPGASDGSHFIVGMTEELFRRVSVQYGIKESIMSKEWPQFLSTLEKADSIRPVPASGQNP